MEINNGANPPNNDDIPQTFACDQCGKEFPSEKALRGHRMHHFRRPRADVAPPPLEGEGAGRRWVLALECPDPNPNPNPIISWSTKGKRGRGPTKPVDEAHAVSEANINEMFDGLTKMIKFVSSRGEDDPAAASSSSKRLRPDFHLARGLSYDEATDTVSFSRRALLSRDEQDDHPSNAVVDREADDDDGKEGEEEEGRRGGEAAQEEEEEDGGGGGDRNGGDRDGGRGAGDGAGPLGEGPRDICNLNKPYVPNLNEPYVPENDD